MEESLNNVIHGLKAPKNQRNKFGGFNYRSAEDILEALKPLLKQNNLRLKLTDDIVAVGERVYVKATAIITDGKNTEEATAFAREEFAKKGMDSSQITGSASSYARKYALNGLFNIDDSQDADIIDNSKEEVIEVVKPTEKQIAKIYELSDKIGAKKSVVEARIKNIKSEDDAKWAIQSLEKKIEEKK